MELTNVDAVKAEPVPGVPKKYFRGDIEGLRAVAVTLVILDHLIGWPSGGFIGVDIFFVLSGFLITGLLLREYSKTQSISFLDFYGRRVRRIAPAAVLVIIVTVAVGYILLSVARAHEVLIDGIWAFFISANWHFASIGTDYFQATGAISPLQHYWSLSVEEQFYLVWPWLTLALLVAFKSRRRIQVSSRTGGAKRSSPFRAVGIVFFVIVILSFAWSCYQTATDPAVAYFDTLGRTWELAIGAVLAAFSTQLGRIPAVAKPFIAWLGIIGVLASAFFITARMPFPGPTAAVPVIATCLIVVAGITGPRRYLAPLDNPVTRYLGRISYSLYLWHFPAIIYLGIFMGIANPLYVPTVLVVVLILSALSYRFVEDPIRRSSWLSRKKSKKRGHRSHEMRPQSKIAVGGLIFAGAASFAIIVFAFARVSPVAPAEALVPAETIAPTAAAADAGVVEAQKTAIQSALGETTWPDLTPAVSDFGANGRSVIATEWLTDGCLGEDAAQLSDPIANAAHCTFGNPNADAAHTAIVFGDSLAISYAPAIRQALGSDWQVRIYALAACPASQASTNKVDGSAFPECGTFRDWAISQITQVDPGLVFISEATDDIRLTSGATGAAADTEWQTAATKTLTALNQVNGSIIMLNRPPAGTTLYSCQTPLSKPSDCVSTVSQGYQNRDTLMKHVTEAVGGNSRFIDTTTWFCNAGQCPSFISNTPVFADGVHLTNSESIALAPLLSYQLSQLAPRR